VSAAPPARSRLHAGYELDAGRKFGYADAMRAIWTTRQGGPESLEVRETPDPEPAPDEVRIRVRATGLNFADVMARQGMYPDAPKLPAVMGYECAGVIDRVGASVSGLAAGDRVVACPRFGGHADTVCLKAAYVFRIADALSFELAAALPVAYMTAYHMLFNVARIRAGDHVLIHMAAGGVGTAALQLCRTLEGVTTYGTASARKHDYIRQHGCTHAIDYRGLDYVAEIRRLTQGRGVDSIFDALGGKDWKKGYEILRPGGLLVAFGFANMNTGGKRRVMHMLSEATKIPFYTPLKMMGDNRGVAGVNLGHLFGEVELLRGALEQVLALQAQGKLAPHIHASYPFEHAAEAHRALESGESLGKIVLVP
jgi:NADPH:quinone reductase-like Zn-dependent oxidoreductase